MEGEVALVDKDGLESARRSDPLRVQLLPCAIEADCSAKVDQFFETSVRSTRSDGAELHSASFRGRPLKGSDVHLPSKYAGFVLEKNDVDAQKRFDVRGSFTEFRQWNLDCRPSSNDTIQKAISWLSLAEAVHGQQDSSQ